MTRISVRGFAVASATAVTAVGAVVGVASGNEQGEQQPLTDAAGANFLADIPSDEHAQQVSANFGQQAQAQSDAADLDTKKAAEQTARKKAAEAAAAKKKAADLAARKKAEARKAAEAADKEKASRSSRSSRSSAAPGRSSIGAKSSYTVAEVQQMARDIVGAGEQYTCFSNIVQRESTWNYRAQNPSSGAYGLVQALPGEKMASAGADWRTNPATQIKWGLSYMNERYGSPCGAWSFWQANHWY